MKKPNIFDMAIGLTLASVATNAHAYLDPGTGSMLLQVILGGIAGLLVAGKLFWYRILGFFGIHKKIEDDEQTDLSE